MFCRLLMIWKLRLLSIRLLWLQCIQIFSLFNLSFNLIDNRAQVSNILQMSADAFADFMHLLQYAESIVLSAELDGKVTAIRNDQLLASPRLALDIPGKLFVS